MQCNNLTFRSCNNVFSNSLSLGGDNQRGTGASDVEKNRCRSDCRDCARAWQPQPVRKWSTAADGGAVLTVTTTATIRTGTLITTLTIRDAISTGDTSTLGGAGGAATESVLQCCSRVRGPSTSGGAIFASVARLQYCGDQKVMHARCLSGAGESATSMRLLSISLLLVTVSLSGTALAQEQTPLLPLSRLEQCRATGHPRLPDKWHAIFLMAPFTNSQLMLSDIEYDASLPAMRVRLYGLRRGSADFFVYSTDTYALSSGAQGTTCEKLGDTSWRPLPQDWLAGQSRCVGSAPLGETNVSWWKTPVEPAPSSYWIWYKTSDQTPFRLAFQSKSDRLGVLSRYALSYQLRFDPNPDIQLAEITRACQAARQASPGGPHALEQRFRAIASARVRADREIQQLLPELASCTTTQLPTWPDKLAITGLMTPWDANENPYSTEVSYDWTIQAQRSRVFPSSRSTFTAQDALMLGPRGYNVTFHRQDGPTCAPVLPGTLRPDWASRAPCTCEAILTGKSALTPYGTSQIITCPLASPRAAWAWYALDGRPTSFAVTSLPGDQGFGLFAVLDYRDWLPGYDIQQSVFDTPPQCRAPGVSVRAETKKCSTCHVGATGTTR